ncbi:MAG: hypothetical protein GY766_25000 [Herbaspirillum sp.]|uniref:hypothetical protein n=1 Tax=Herbaspirillum sp. TaxID=1890675 RepID=UPI00258ED7DC|nr:hypothetical protein [Herbaspirillum sp.]MCP3658119.1 hypothetical protein [Herbaspirillum sp.]
MPSLQTASARGKAAELRFLQIVLEHGWSAAVPVAEDEPWDALISRFETWLWERVQIKRTYLKYGKPTVNLVRHDGKRYRPDDADWLAAVEVESGRIWLVPFDEVAQYQRKRITEDMACYEMRRTPQEEDHEEVPF